MSERNKPGDGFDDIVAALHQDDAFIETLAAIDEGAAAEDADTPLDDPKLDLVQPYYMESLNDIGAQIYAAFHRLCQKHGIDVNAANSTHSHALYEPVIHELIAEVQEMQGELTGGDTVWASNTIVVDVPDDDDTPIYVQNVPSDEAVVGRFLGPMVAPISDDAHILTTAAGEESDPPIGVGLAIASGVIIDRDGDIRSDALQGPLAIIPLGTIGLDLKKMHFQPE